MKKVITVKNIPLSSLLNQLDKNYAPDVLLNSQHLNQILVFVHKELQQHLQIKIKIDTQESFLKKGKILSPFLKDSFINTSNLNIHTHTRNSTETENKL